MAIPATPTTTQDGSISERLDNISELVAQLVAKVTFLEKNAGGGDGGSK